MIYYAHFVFVGLPHIAIGDETSAMPIYGKPTGSEKYIKRAVKFPAILKFVDESAFTEVQEGSGDSVEQILTKLQIELDEESEEPGW